MNKRNRNHIAILLTCLVMSLSACKFRSIHDSRVPFFGSSNASSIVTSLSSLLESSSSIEASSISSEAASSSNAPASSQSDISSSAPTSSKEPTLSSSALPSSSSQAPISSSSSNPPASSSSLPPASSSSSTGNVLDINTHYRINPVSATGDTLNVYNLDGTIEKTLRKSSESDSSTWYVDYRDVALYYLGYGELPANYCYYDQSTDSSGNQSKADAYDTFGNKARLYTKTYTRTDGYAVAFDNPNEYRYFEADIGLDSKYAKSANWNRGSGRLVILYKGLRAYGTDTPTIFYTEDHYASFRECYNYWNFSSTQVGDGGYGPIFNGEGSGYGNYIAPTTISI